MERIRLRINPHFVAERSATKYRVETRLDYQKQSGVDTGGVIHVASSLGTERWDQPETWSPVTINWPAFGSCSIEETEEFTQALSWAVTEAKRLDTHRRQSTGPFAPKPEWGEYAPGLYPNAARAASLCDAAVADDPVYGPQVDEESVPPVIGVAWSLYDRGDPSVGLFPCSYSPLFPSLSELDMFCKDNMKNFEAMADGEEMDKLTWVGAPEPKNSK